MPSLPDRYETGRDSGYSGRAHTPVNVLIVARTKMHDGYRCISGLTNGNQPIRLLTADGNHWDNRSPFAVGQIWDMDFQLIQDLIPPHLEDVLVSRHRLLGVQPNLRGHLLRRVIVWKGGIDQIFGGVLDYTGNNNGFVCERRGLPQLSTGFWLPDRDLTLREDGKHYDYRQGFFDRGLSYVGEEPSPPAVLLAETLVRVSLVRWWQPYDAIEKRCYAQLSGWYV